MRVNIRKKVTYPEGQGYINYIDDDFTMFYVPDVVKNVLVAYPIVGNKKKRKLKKMLTKAKELVTNNWEIRDAHDKAVKEYVLAAEIKEERVS